MPNSVSHVMIPTSWLSAAVANLWAYHNEDEPCDGTCEVMRLVHTGKALLFQLPGHSTSSPTFGKEASGA